MSIVTQDVKGIFFKTAYNWSTVDQSKYQQHNATSPFCLNTYVLNWEADLNHRLTSVWFKSRTLDLYF